MGTGSPFARRHRIGEGPDHNSGPCHVQGRFLAEPSSTTSPKATSETRIAPTAGSAAQGVKSSLLEVPLGGLCGRAGPGSPLESALERAFSVPPRGPSSRVFDPLQSRLRLYVYKSPFAANLRAACRAKSSPNVRTIAASERPFVASQIGPFRGLRQEFPICGKGPSRHGWARNRSAALLLSRGSSSRSRAFCREALTGSAQRETAATDTAHDTRRTP
jgi:hypothetical protein